MTIANEPPARILYLALADARGHLMRAHLLRELLATQRIVVEIVTTSREGQMFLASLGTPSRLLSEHFRVVFEGCHDMSRDKTDRCVRDYYLDPRRALRDIARLREMARGADLVVDDSLHPALMLAPLLPGNEMRVVHLFGENIWQAAARNFEDRSAPVLETLYPVVLTRMRDAAFACIEHSAAPRAGVGQTYVVPSIIGAPLRDARAVRSAFGVAAGERLAAVYLNPHFTDSSVAIAIERALGSEGYRMVAVGEGYVGRLGWRGSDPDFASVVAAADLYVSGAGMGALAQSRAFGTPLITLLGEQPEQRANALAAQGTHPAFRAVALDAANLESDLREAIAGLRAIRGPRSSVEAIQEQWTRIFIDLLERVRKERQDDRTNAFSHRRNEQPPRRWSRRSGSSRWTGAPARTSTEADLAARSLDGARRHA